MSLFEGIKIVDFTHAYAGPFATMFMADFGAEVIKIEKINGGDQARGWGPFKNDYSGYYASFNRGKQSIAVDLKSKDGQKIVRELIKEADIVCSNFKAGTLEKFGLGYDDMVKENPKVIYATSSGFGTKGELSKFAAYDNVIQAMSGVMDVNGFPDKGPTKIGPAVGDSYSGLLLLLGTVIAYYNRLKRGEGQKVDVTMLGALFGLLEYPVLEYANNNNLLTRTGNASVYTAPNDVFKAKKEYVAISVMNDEQWIEFCKVLGIEASEKYDTNSKRLACKEELKKIIESAISDKTADEVEALFDGTKVPASSVISIAEAIDHPQWIERDMIIDVKDPVIGDIKLVGNPIHMSANSPITDIPSPTLGEHTDSILKGLGYTPEEIEELHNNKVV